MIDVVEIMKHWQAGRNLSEIARGLGLDRKTVRKYLAAPEREGLVPGDPPLRAYAGRDHAAPVESLA